MLPPGPEKNLASAVAQLVHADKKRDAAKLVAEVCKINIKLDDDNPAKYIPVLQHYFHILLESNAAEEAAQLLWTPNLFTPEPQSTRDVWKLYETTNQGLIMGGGSMSKSYSMGVRLFLEYARDPEYTTVRVLGPSEDHLETNLFSHLVTLHNRATLPMPGEIGELFIGRSRRSQTGSIKGLVIPVGKSKKAGRIQGTKRVPRPEPHPTFGALSRLFLFLDEIENIPMGVWGDIDNVLTQVEEGGEVGGFKIFGAYNPRNQRDEVGQRAEPPFGWESFDADTHFRWKSVRGWDVLRLDGERSENVAQGKVVYPGLQTRAGLDAIAKNAGGRNSPGYFTMGRGAYPPQGIELAVIPPGMLTKMRGEFIWLSPPVPVAACDLALEGGAGAPYTLGKWGRATGMKLRPNMEFPQGQTVMFKDTSGNPIVRWGLQADQQFMLPKGDTVAMAVNIIAINKKAGVKPEFFACDRTGHGAGIADLIKHDWSPGIHDVNYSNNPTDAKLMLEDSKTCLEEFDRVCCELWFGLRAYGEFGYLLIAPSMGLEKLEIQVTQRKFKSVGKKKKVETKKDYISRGHESPDEGDSLCLFVFAARKGSGVILSMKGHDIEIPGIDDDAGWADERPLIGGTRIDPSNRTDYLDDRNLDMEIL
jgi:hypothetical protein